MDIRAELNFVRGDLLFYSRRRLCESRLEISKACAGNRSSPPFSGRLIGSQDPTRDGIRISRRSQKYRLRRKAHLFHVRGIEALQRRHKQRPSILPIAQCSRLPPSVDLLVMICLLKAKLSAMASGAVFQLRHFLQYDLSDKNCLQPSDQRSKGRLFPDPCGRR